MYSLILFAEENISRGATDPAAWATLADKIGPMLFFAVFVFVAFFVLILAIGWIGYRLGNRVVDRFNTFLDGMEISAAVNAKSLDAQTHLLERICEKMGIVSLKSLLEEKDEKHDEEK
jgi:hypothetical protein